MSITGANFLVAESGAVVLVTNEGNGRFAAATPPVRVTVAGIDKVINTRRDLATLLKLLPRSATGQEISNYVSLSVGAGRNAENPQHHYIVLVDGGRSAILQSEFAEMLRCIRCGACMNHCPVYQLVGGHAYGWVYPGPMGAVLTPLLAGIKAAPDLPHAATMCGACEVVCPVKIPLPDLMRKLRERQATKKENIRPISERVAMRLWAFCARRPLLYSLIAMAAARMLKIIARRRGRISQLPFMQGWFANRDLPAPQGRTFRELQRAALEN
jgi:L-lactate dehydrogenase complex protein LldF